MDDDRAVEHPGAVHERRADHEHRQQVGRRGDDLGDRVLDRVEQRVLQEQVVDRVAAQAQLGEDRDRDAVVVSRRGPARAPCARWSPGRRSRPGTVQAATRANPWA